MKRILLVDLSAIFWRNWHASKDQEIGAAFENTVRKVNSSTHGYDAVAVCCDQQPYKRKAISADYKAQRDTPDPAAVGQLHRVKERLTADGLLIWSAEGYEADDIIATACKDLIEQTDYTVDILSGDKDLAALVDARTTLVRLDNGERMGPNEVTSKFGVPPDMITELLALTGDKADNIPGVPGIGPKKAAQLLIANEFEDIASGSWDLVAEGKTRELILANSDNIRKSHALVKLLTDAPIDIKQLFETREVKALENELTPEDLDTDDGAELPIQSPVVAVAPEPEKSKPHASTAIEVYQGSFERQLEPRTQGQALSLARGIINSRQFGFQNEYEAHAVILTGREMGLTAMASIRSISFFKGKPCLSAALIEALVLRSGKAEYFECVSSDEKHAVYVTKRIGSKIEQRQQFTLKDAERAQLTKTNSNWEKYPQNMCEWRAIAFLARKVYPDVILGMYTREELEEVA